MPTELSVVMETVADVDGWMTPGQASTLYDAATRCPAGGLIVEIGSFRGRSTIVLASAAAPGVEIVAIDPHAGNDRGPQEFDGFEDEAADDHQVFLDNLQRAGVADRVRHLRMFSDAALAHIDRTDRRALHRRCASLRTGARRHPPVRGARRRRRHDADPRLVLVDRRDRGDHARARLRSTFPLRRTLAFDDHLPGRPGDRRAPAGSATPAASSPSSPGSSATSGSRCSCRSGSARCWPASGGRFPTGRTDGIGCLLELTGWGCTAPSVATLVDAGRRDLRGGRPRRTGGASWRDRHADWVARTAILRRTVAAP